MTRPVIALVLTTAALCLGQAPQTIQWAIAPSKATQPTATSVTPAYSGNQIVFTGATLKNLISYAYGWNEFTIAGGPSWAATTRYDVVARAAVRIAPTQFQEIARQFLEGRFRLKSHKEMRTGPAYDLVIAGGRHRLVASTAPQSLSSVLRGRLIAKRWTMSQLATLLQRLPETGRPVRDKTGLSGEFDIDLQYAAGLPAALEQQLGLRLVPATAPVEYLVIDSAAQP